MKGSQRAHTINYSSAVRFLKKLSGVSLFTGGLYILLPTPDGVIIHPLFGSLLSHIFGMSFKQGVVISIATYTTIGIIFCLIGGGKQIYRKLKIRLTERYEIGEKAA